MRKFLKLAAGAVVLALFVVLLFGATADRATGKRMIYACNFQAVANSDDIDACAFLAPQAMTIASATIHCDTVTSDPQIIIDTPSGDTYVAAANFPATSTLLALTIADATIADEVEVDVNFVADAGDAGTDCVVTLVLDL